MKPIADYGLLGDTRTAALVSSDGSLDWLCVPRFDGDPIFGRLVGGPAAGRFRLGPATAAAVVERKYRHHTATLETGARVPACPGDSGRHPRPTECRGSLAVPIPTGT
jgi:GH15 family glucan-1,4-alpha-glucosidase